jgi:hypothetical protein
MQLSTTFFRPEDSVLDSSCNPFPPGTSNQNYLLDLDYHHLCVREDIFSLMIQNMFFACREKERKVATVGTRYED